MKNLRAQQIESIKKKNEKIFQNKLKKEAIQYFSNPHQYIATHGHSPNILMNDSSLEMIGANLSIPPLYAESTLDHYQMMVP